MYFQKSERTKINTLQYNLAIISIKLIMRMKELRHPYPPSSMAVRGQISLTSRITLAPQRNLSQKA